MLKMAYFLSGSSSEESLCSEPDQVLSKEATKVQERVSSKRAKKLPTKLRDYVPSTTMEEERLQKSKLHVIYVRY